MNGMKFILCDVMKFVICGLMNLGVDVNVLVRFIRMFVNGGVMFKWLIV